MKISRRPRKGPTHVAVDSTGLKIFGEGEWAKAGFREARLPAAVAGRLCKADRGAVRQHGAGKRRTWRKIHLAVDETREDIIGIEVTPTAWGDSEILPGLLDQVEEEVSQIPADGACDSHGGHAAIAERGARATIPPRDGAVVWGNDPPRDAILQDIDAKGLAGWKNDSDYHRRRIAENMRFRLKQRGAVCTPAPSSGK